MFRKFISAALWIYLGLVVLNLLFGIVSVSPALQVATGVGAAFAAVTLPEKGKHRAASFW